MIIILPVSLNCFSSVPTTKSVTIAFLGNIVSPVVMGVVFFIVVTPIGLIMRLLGRDLLRVNKNESASTYWIDREKKTDTMKRQF